MAIRITDKLYSSTVAGVVADSFSISGGYITVQTIKERDKLSAGPLVVGQPLYVTEENKTYRWDGSSWEEDDTLNNHIGDKGNPHQVTKSQVGLSNVDNTADLDKPISNAVQEALDNIGDTLTDVIRDNGDQSIKGSLTLVKEGENNKGNLVVQGDLVVSGTTIIENHETLQVTDNILILNSNGNSLGSALSGTVIKTAADTAYGIVYNAVDDSVSLGKGIIDDKENFIFSEGEGNPIAVRDQANSFSNGNLIVWDSAKNRLVDGGTLPTLEDLGGVSQEDHSQAIDEINSKIDEVESIANENASSIQDINECIGDLASLPTEDKDTIVGAIDEIYSRLDPVVEITGISQTLRDHLDSKSNPHEVSIDQLITRNTAFNSNFEATASNIKMNGSASVGSLNTVARADHIHPTDISRAPATHISVEANSLTLGHVMVDSTLNDSSANPVQNKVIKTYIDDQIDGLKSIYNPIIENDSDSWEASETITSVSQTNGKIEVTCSKINIAKSQVADLEDDLSNLDTAIANEASAREAKDTELANAIKTEEENRAAADATVLSDAQAAIKTAITEFETNYNLYLLETLPTDKNKQYFLSYNKNTSKWEWGVMALDEGILK